ncbi:hypothetical protein E2C01_060904 [Portunus trituberculatus]|uniref:Uncharacterized protein n=1 Tax=Portunus trituberculatus TaxID=210409 RepID=A0A5B7H9C9_PORTR|nr:hypothetical protein [Portunus trituberculatus]
MGEDTMWIGCGWGAGLGFVLKVGREEGRMKRRQGCRICVMLTGDGRAEECNVEVCDSCSREGGVEVSLKCQQTAFGEASHIKNRRCILKQIPTYN